MKFVGILLLIVAIVFAVFGIRTANQQAHEAQRADRERVIAQRQIVLLMTMPEVERSLGAPASKSLAPTGQAIWHYSNHQVVFDPQGRVIKAADFLFPPTDSPTKLHSTRP